MQTSQSIEEHNKVDILQYKKMRHLYLKDLYKYHNCTKNNNPRYTIYPSGTCIPGARKIFVHSNGNILLCEKVDETNPMFCIGDVKSGVNFEKVKNILNRHFNAVHKKCKYCWASYFCTACFRHIEQMEDDDQLCNLIRSNIKKEYADYLSKVVDNKELCAILDSITPIL